MCVCVWYFCKQSPDGDIIDCVHISKQPAFDHPFLKDHKIQVIFVSAFASNSHYLFAYVLAYYVFKQMNPSTTPELLFEENKVSKKPKLERINPVTQLWHQNGVCSEGTIPVRRTKKEDVLRASSVKRYGKKKHRTVPLPRSADPDLANQSVHQVDFLILLPTCLLLSFLV